MHGYQDRGSNVPRGRFADTGRFGRLFPELRTQKKMSPEPAVLGAAGGPMDGGSPPPTDTSQDNPRIKAGYTFLGQFVDHDLTFDPTSILEQQIDLQATRNFRTPAFELDSLYGLGPGAQPWLYDKTKPFRFLIGENGNDVPRNFQEVALIGDPRNDENGIISQLHTSFLKFHNAVFEKHTDASQSGPSRFEAAQKLVRWHYQWMVLHEFLPRLVGSKTVKRMLQKPRFRFPREPFMPVEFSVAAYRFGHSQVRPGYGGIGTGGAILFPADPDNIPHLGGGRIIPPDRQVNWAAFFGTNAQPSKLIDIRLSSTLLNLPNSVIPPGVPAHQRSLAIRNLQRGLDANLPSGDDVADFLDIPKLKAKELWKDVKGGSGEGPLWFYCLREAEVRAAGHRLAGVGAEIVAGVFVALMLADRASFLAQKPGWTPTLPSAQKGRFTMTDLLNLANNLQLQAEDLATLPGGD